MLITLYFISIFTAFMVLAWAFHLVDEDCSLSATNMGPMVVAASGFSVFPFINVATTIILAHMCHTAMKKRGKSKQ